MPHSVARKEHFLALCHNIISFTYSKSFKREKHLHLSSNKMKDIRANYVCTLCSQTFTRKPSGERHNLNLHSGMAAIVRFIDYIVGRIAGRYQPSNPLVFRRKKNVISRKNDSLPPECKNANIVNEVSSQYTIMPDKTKESSQSTTRVNFGFGYNQDSLDILTNNIGPRLAGSKDANQTKSVRNQNQAVYQKTSSSSSYRTLDSPSSDKIAKCQEFATLIKKHYSGDIAKDLMFCASTLGAENWEQGGWIDEMLVFLRNF